MSEGDAVHWQGTPAPLPAMLVWAAILAIALGTFALLYWYMAVTGSCVDFLLEDDCIRRRGGRRGGIEAIFIVLAVIATGAALITFKIAIGFPHERYSVTESEVKLTTSWPLSGTRSQPLAHVNIKRDRNGVTFTGTGEKPVSFGPLRKEDAERVFQLVQGLKAALDPSRSQDRTI